MRWLILGFFVFAAQAAQALGPFSLGVGGGADSGGVNTFTSTNVFNLGITVNETGQDSDTRMESTGNPWMFFVDSGANRVGIGTGVPQGLLHVFGSAATVLENSAGDVQLKLRRATGSDAAQIALENANGFQNWTLTMDGNEGLTFGDPNGVTTVLRMLQSGNVGVGVVTPETKLHLSSGIFLTDGTSPYHTFTAVTSSPTAVATRASIWAVSGGATSEMKVIDGAGNITTISPHNGKGDWAYKSENVLTGKKVYVNMEKFIRAMEALTGEKFIYETESEAEGRP